MVPFNTSIPFPSCSNNLVTDYISTCNLEYFFMKISLTEECYSKITSLGTIVVIKYYFWITRTANLDGYLKSYNSSCGKWLILISAHIFFWVGYRLHSGEEESISVIFIFPAHRYIHRFSWVFLFLDQKAHQLGAKANKHPFYLYLNSLVSPESSDVVQDLAGSLKPFPQRLPYKTAAPQWLSASAVPSLGHEDWFSFSLQVKVRSVCPQPATRETDNTTTRSTWKTRPGGAFPPPLCFSLG